MDIRSVDLNLLPVLEAVMKARSVSRAGEELKASRWLRGIVAELFSE